MNDEHSSEHSDIISRDDGYPEYRPAPQPLPFYVANELAQLRTENEQLRTLVSSSLLLMLDMRLDLIGAFGVLHQAQKFTIIREQAKALGIEVQE